MTIMFYFSFILLEKLLKYFIYQNRDFTVSCIKKVILLNSKQYFHLKAYNLFEIKVNSYLFYFFTEMKSTCRRTTMY